MGNTRRSVIVATTTTQLLSSSFRHPFTRFQVISSVSIMCRLLSIVLYCIFHAACSFDWRESIAWRDSYAELSSYYALTGFAMPSWTTKISKIHVEEDDYRYYIDFSTDFARFGLPLDYIVAMRVWQANPLQRLLMWNSLYPLTNLTLHNTDTPHIHTHHRLSYPYALSLQNEIHVLSLVQSRLSDFITSDFDTAVHNRRLERVMCGMIVTVFKHMETILRDLDKQPSASFTTTHTPIIPPSDSPTQALHRVVASIIPADDATYHVLRSSFMDYINVQLQPLLDLYQQQQQQQQEQEQLTTEHHQSDSSSSSNSNKVTILEEVRVNEAFYQVLIMYAIDLILTLRVCLLACLCMLFFLAHTYLPYHGYQSPHLPALSSHMCCRKRRLFVSSKRLSNPYPTLAHFSLAQLPLPQQHRRQKHPNHLQSYPPSNRYLNRPPLHHQPSEERM